MGLNDHNEDVTRKGWQIVEKNQNKISTMVMDMLSFSKDREPDLAPAELNEVVADVIELMQARADGIECGPRVEAGREHADFAIRQRRHSSGGAERGDQRHRRLRRAARTAKWKFQRSMSPITAWPKSSCKITAWESPPTIAEHFSGVRFRTKEPAARGWDCRSARKLSKNTAAEFIVESEVGRGSRFILEFPAVLGGLAWPTVSRPMRSEETNVSNRRISERRPNAGVQ